MLRAVRVLPVLLALLPFAASALAQDTPLQAGSGGVPVPRRTKTVKPEYPAEAQARGIGGIVILELVVDTTGKVASVQVVRSVPPFDDAAVAAARQWEYEVTKVGGKPVSVRLSVPITFLVKVPEVTRQAGIPELRQGVSPAFPPDARESASVTAELTLDPEGQVADAQVVQGTMPWSGALLQALRTWRFMADGTNAVLSFRVEADFVAPSKGKAARVDLRLTGLRRSESLASGQTALPASTPVAAAPSPSPTPSPTPPPASPPETAPAAAPASGPCPPPSPVPSPSSASPAAAAAAPPAASSSPAPPAVSQPSPAASSKPAPPIETISAPSPETPPGAAAPVTESGVSAIRDVVLSEGVPDLTKGRRPSPPPLARMAGATGAVEIRFAVNAAGVTSVQSVSGPDILKPAAEQTVASWIFRRASAMRLHLLAVITYRGDAASAAVRPE